MNGIEFFAGSRSIGKIADFYGIDIISTDNFQYGDIDYIVDVLKFDYNEIKKVPDFVWLSPPCTAFSVAAIGKNWTKGSLEPKTETAKTGLLLAKKNYTNC